MATSLKRRVRTLEEDHGFDVCCDPKELTTEELLWNIRNHLEERFEAGELKDVEKKIREEEAKGKTMVDINEEYHEWFADVVHKLATGEI